MSDEHTEGHQSLIKTPKQLIAAIAAGFIIPIVCIVLLVEYVTDTSQVGAGSTSLTPDSIAARIRPVADEGFTLRDIDTPRQLQAGADVYKAVCSACHTTGAAGAPKLGDASAWSARIAQGYDTLVAHAVQGFHTMPAKGGNPDLDEVEVARAMVYLVNQSGAKFKEPEIKAIVAAGPAVPTSSTTATPVQANSPAATLDAAPTKLAADAGKKLYDTSCTTCHGAGIVGAPKFGDKVAWANRIKQGQEVLYTHAIKGFQGKTGMMPPKGGSTASDEEVKAAVDYMTAAVK